MKNNTRIRQARLLGHLQQLEKVCLQTHVVHVVVQKFNHFICTSPHTQWLQIQFLKLPTKLCSETRKTRVLTQQCQVICLLLKAVTVLDPVLPLGESDLRGHHLGVGVATAHSLAILKMGVQIPFLKLAHSHVSMLVDLPMNKNRNSEVGCVWNHKI